MFAVPFHDDVKATSTAEKNLMVEQLVETAVYVQWLIMFLLYYALKVNHKLHDMVLKRRCTC